MTCPGGQVLCDDRQLCIHQSWVCDSREDCNDGSDEANCSNLTTSHCITGAFQCSNGNCVGMDLFCDGDDNCGDNSDEEGDCHRVQETPAPPPCEDGFACGSLCLALSARCNGTAECSDLSDESNCNLCYGSTFACRSDGRCVPGRWRCDGAADCEDGSDERDCPQVSKIAQYIFYISAFLASHLRAG